MMKKITRIAALLATTALLFGAIGCSESEDPTPAVPVDTVTPTSFELTSGANAESKTFTLTLGTTQIKADALADLKKGDLPAEQIDAIVQQSGSDIIISKVALTEDATATELALSLTMASEAVAGTKGTLTLTLPANFTANGEAITKTLNYEIKGSTPTTPPNEDDPENPPSSATAKTYDFATLTTADVSALGITATEATDKDTGKVAAKSDNEYTLSNGALLYSKAAGNLKIRFTTKGDITSAITAVNFGGQSIGDSNTTATPGEVGTTESAAPSRYIAVPVDASNFTVSVTYKSTNDKKIQIVVVDENGKILAKDEQNGAKAEKTYTTGTLEKGSASKIRIYLYRIDANNSGGADVSKIVVTPVSQ